MAQHKIPDSSASATTPARQGFGIGADSLLSRQVVGARGGGMFEALLILVVALNISADFMDRRAALRSDINALSLWTTIVQFLLVMPMVGLVDAVSLPLLALAAAVGAFSAAARIPWYRALSTAGEKLSRLAPFSRISSVMVIVLAYLVLGEPYSQQKMIGGFVVVGGALMMSLAGKTGNWRSYLASNRAFLFVAIFAASVAVISVFYKYMMNVGVSIISAYFYLKLFQCAFAVLYAFHHGTLVSSFSTILDLQLFVAGRAIQTLAALLYIFVLRQVDLSRVEPIAAAIGPLLFLIIEKVSEARARARGAPAAPAGATKSEWLRYAGLAVIAGGLWLLVKK